ncbi:lanthionine synthetase LanC family protein [Micromonospora sp. NPDC001898]|uniref:class III lanthionine synthetase LanKC N-terminal domain-containing protein n=1 Tax=Micromonospora sp. NPDC001898 TaxID=3364221 RepID=UPI0036C07A34
MARLLDVVVGLCGRAELPWSVRHVDPPGWVTGRPVGGRTPRAGWKLHITAVESNALEVLRRCLPAIVARSVPFKVADAALLARLNDGSEGLAQIGKFLTVYPADPVEATKLATELDALTRGVRGPLPPSDRPFSPTSAVSYRYGAFEGEFTRTSLGAVVPAYRGPDGAIVPDPRLTHYVAPPDVVDPFAEHGDAAPPSAITDELLHGRYLLANCLSRSVRGDAYEAIDIDTARACVVKRAPRDRLLTGCGPDARELLRGEATVLAGLRPDPRFPDVYEVVERHGDLCLVEQRLDGVPLDRYVSALATGGERIGRAQLLRWAGELVAMLTRIEQRGWVYSDLKSGNTLVSPEGTLQLVDFELCAPVGEPATLPRRGTRGYLDVQGSSTGGPRDGRIHSLGAVLYFLATAAEPSRAPDGSLLRRPIRDLNPAVDDDVEELVERCLGATGTGFTSLRAVGDAVESLASGRSGQERVRTRPRRPLTEPADPSPGRLAETIRTLGDSLCADAEPIPGQRGLAWNSPHDPTGRLALRDLNSGAAGNVLALAEITREYGEEHHKRVLRAAASALVRESPILDDRLPGLYVGEAGVSAALLRAGQVLGDRSMVAAAARHGEMVAAASHDSPDLFNGTAGRLRFHLMMWNETGDSVHRVAARTAADVLLDRMDGTGSDFAGWRTPPGYGDLSGQVWLGYAHGAAGIADCLLDALEEFGDERCAAAVVDTVRLLDRHGVPVSPHGSAMGWPASPGQSPSAPYWCHGASGIGTMLTRAARIDLCPRAGDLADRAGRAVAETTWVGPTQCHGLAGNIEFLLDLYRNTGEQSWLTAAHRLWGHLQAYRRDVDGRTGWESDVPGTVHAGYLVGYAGTAMCLLRLARPSHRPRHLTPAGFRATRHLP